MIQESKVIETMKTTNNTLFFVRATTESLKQKWVLHSQANNSLRKQVKPHALNTGMFLARLA